jgi:hypothetical protein
VYGIISEGVWLGTEALCYVRQLPNLVIAHSHCARRIALYTAPLKSKFARLYWAAARVRSATERYTCEVRHGGKRQKVDIHAKNRRLWPQLTGRSAATVVVGDGGWRVSCYGSGRAAVTGRRLVQAA